MSSQYNPVIIQLPADERPSAADVPGTSTLFKPEGVARLDILENIDGTKSWVEVAEPTGTARGVAPITVNGDHEAHSLTGDVTIGTDGTSDWIRYVDSDTGSDDSDGSQLSPWETYAYALSQVPPVNQGKCRIHLIGAGPYTEPQYVTGSIPEGPNAEPLLVIGDELTQLATGACTSVASPVAATNLATTTNQYRGRWLHVLTGTGAGTYGSIANNDNAGNFTSISNDSFGMAAASTFEIVSCTTVINFTTNSRIGFGKIVYWRCKLAGGGIRRHDGYVECGYDCCEIDASNLFAQNSATVWSLSVSLMGQWFRKVTTAGTQSGAAGVYMSKPESVIQSQDDGSIRGFLVGNCQILLEGNAYVEFDGLDIIAPGELVRAVGRSVAILTRYNRLTKAINDANPGVRCYSGSTVILENTLITNCADPINVKRGGFVSMSSVTGSSGNTGSGLFVEEGGTVWSDGLNTLTAADGDVKIDAQSPKTWANAGTTIWSSDGQVGSRLFWCGGFLGAAGLVTFYLPMGGLPGSVAGTNNSASRIRYPVLPGGRGQRLSVQVLTNALAADAVATVYKNGAGTAITVTVPAGATGVFSDTTHSETWDDEDAIDLQWICTGGGGGNALTCSASLQIQ